MDESVLAVLPARGGSKRVPNKNIRDINGKPLIAYAIDQTRKAESVSEHVVSTDDEEIKRTAKKYEGHVPFDRPEELATDVSPAEAVVTHALDWYEQQGQSFDVVCLVSVTVPLREPADINGTVQKLLDNDGQSVISISEYQTPPQWALTTNEQGYLEEYDESASLWSKSSPRSQDLPVLKHPNGAVYATDVKTWRETEQFYTERTLGYEMPPLRSIDIDELWELELVRGLMEYRD